MTKDIIEGLKEMGFVISKIKGEPYIIDRLSFGSGIYGKISDGSHFDIITGKKTSGSESQKKGIKKGVTWMGEGIRFNEGKKELGKIKT